jgi:hypothetical protein
LPGTIPGLRIARTSSRRIAAVAMNRMKVMRVNSKSMPSSENDTRGSG